MPIMSRWHRKEVHPPRRIRLFAKIGIAEFQSNSAGNL